jgi:cytochrome c oxidase cbb3-type subunit 1
MFKNIHKLINTPNSTALAFLIAAGFWFIIGTLYGMFSAIHLVSPEFFSNIPFLVFGRERPVHGNTVLFGFATTMLLGAGYYYVPALLRTKLWSEPLGWLSWLLWNTTIASGPFTFSFGLTQGREYTEYIWIFDVILMLSLLVAIVNIIMTIVNRREQVLYVSVWYFVGMLLWTAGSYPIGNVMWRPPDGALRGILDSIYLWFWGHNLPGLVLTPLAVGAAYYVLPRVVKSPLYSYFLSLIGFWTLVALYTHIGGHHLLQAPIPNWLKGVSVMDSIAMVIPVFVATFNLLVTTRGRGGMAWGDPGGRFVMGGLIWYIITCIQGPVQSLPTVQRVTHFTNWTIGHSHIAVLGFAGYIALGAMWHILPQIVQRRLWSEKLANLQFWFITTGLTGFFVVLTIAGLIQGSAWNNGEMVYRVLPELYVYMAFRAAFGIFIISGAIIGFYNMIMTIRHGLPLTDADQEHGT